MSALADLLIRHEGLRLKPYRDTVGKLTIGVGRNLDDHGISEDEAAYLLQNDIDRIQAQCRLTFPWFTTLDPCRQDAIADMVFNLGMSGFQGFHKTIGALAQQQWAAAAQEMLASEWAIHVGKRATELSVMIETGQYQA